MPSTAMHVWKPSDSRLVTIDSFVPVPRGGSLTPPLPLNWAAKDPSDVLDYQVDISPALVGDEGDSVGSLDVTVSPSGPGDLMVTSSLADGARIVMWVSGGHAGTVYTVTIDVITVNGRRLQRAILLPVVSMADPTSPTGVIEVSTGVTLTDHNGNPLLI